MTTEQLSRTTQPSTPDSPKPVWSQRKTIAAVAVGVAGAGGAAIWAAAGSGTATPGGSTGVSSLATGDTVTIVATTSGDTATADSVTEATTSAQAAPGQRL